MRIPRFYQAQPLQVGVSIDLSPENFRHAIQVMRLKPDSSIILFNGESGEFQATLTEVGKRSAKVEIHSFDAVSRESPLSTKLVLALIKPDKMDFAIQKSVELGVNAIQPLNTERSVIQIKANRLEKKMHHWGKVIISACEQSGRTKIPEILTPINSLQSYLQQPTTAMRIALLPTALTTLKGIALQENNVDLLIGPEGGYSHAEEQLLNESNISTITFGPRILRAETAVVAGLTALQAEWGDVTSAY